MVRQRSAKPPSPGSNPGAAFSVNSEQLSVISYQLPGISFLHCLLFIELSNCSANAYQATQLSLIFGYRHRHHRNKLDSSVALSTDSHLPTLAVKRPPERADNTKTNIVVDVVALRPIVVVAKRGTAVFRIVVPGTAPQSGSPTPSLLPQPSE